MDPLGGVSARVQWRTLEIDPWQINNINEHELTRVEPRMTSNGEPTFPTWTEKTARTLTLRLPRSKSDDMPKFQSRCLRFYLTFSLDIESRPFDLCRVCICHSTATTPRRHASDSDTFLRAVRAWLNIVKEGKLVRSTCSWRSMPVFFLFRY